MSSYYERKKKGGMKFRISFIFLFIFASFAACFVLYMRENMYPAASPGEGGAVTSRPETVPLVIEGTGESGGERQSTADINPVAERAAVDSSYFESCMFAGDSLMVGLASYGFIPEERVAAGIGMSAMTINTHPLTYPDGSEILAADKVNEYAPDNLYILMGLNLLGAYTDEQMLAAYGDFVDSINRDKTNIYVISVPPVTGERETDGENPILNSDIDRFNSDLLKFANNRCIYYIDLNTELKGADGRFPAEDAEQDGIHFKKSTYRTMLDFLLTHVCEE